MKYNILGIIIAIAIVIITATILFTENRDLGGYSISWISGTTNSSSTVSNSASSVVSDNTGRLYLSLVNDGANVVYLHFIATSTGVVAQEGIRLSATGGSFEIDANNLYLGEIYAITSSGTSTLTIVEK